MSLFLDDDDNNDIHRSHLQRESNKLNEDFPKHRSIPVNSNFDQQQQQQQQGDNSDDDEMSDSDLDKAATRIQASYRGYKTRKELSSTSVANPSQTHENYKNST